MKTIITFTAMKETNTQIIVVSDRDKEMVKMLSAGMKGNQIAKALKTNENTLAFELNQLRTKFGCLNSTALVAYFIREKLID